ncbi:unnamed protein product, partial [Allacma fusca]
FTKERERESVPFF